LAQTRQTYLAEATGAGCRRSQDEGIIGAVIVVLDRIVITRAVVVTRSLVVVVARKR
jgi:hypothetical protein